MGNFAPTYMTTYDIDGPDVNLANLALSAATFANDAPEDTAIGNITGGAGGIAAGHSTYTLISPTTGQLKIVGTALKVGATVTPDAGTITAIIQEDNQYAQKSPHQTTFTITVT